MPIDGIERIAKVQRQNNTKKRHNQRQKQFQAKHSVLQERRGKAVNPLSIIKVKQNRVTENKQQWENCHKNINDQNINLLQAPHFISPNLVQAPRKIHTPKSVQAPNFNHSNRHFFSNPVPIPLNYSQDHPIRKIEPYVIPQIQQSRQFYIQSPNKINETAFSKHGNNQRIAHNSQNSVNQNILKPKQMNCIPVNYPSVNSTDKCLDLPFCKNLTKKQKCIWLEMVGAVNEIHAKLNQKQHPVRIGRKRKIDNYENGRENRDGTINLISETIQPESVYSSHCYSAISKVDYDFNQCKKSNNPGLEDIVPGFESNVKACHTVYLRNEKTGQIETPIGQYILINESIDEPKYYFKPIICQNYTSKEFRWMSSFFQQ